MSTPSLAAFEADPRFDLVQTLVSDWIARHARQRPDHVAVVSGDTRVSWADFDARLNRVANVLLERGLRKGDKVALLAPNSVSALEVLFGTLRAGGVIVPLSGLLTAQILAKLVDDSDARFMFVAAEYSDLVEPIRALRGNMAENGWFGLGFSRDSFADYEAALERVSNARPAAVVLPEDDCNIIYSSGTTGTPKGIVHTHFARSLFGFGLSVRLRMDGTAVTLLTTPLFTNGTWMTLLPTVGVGGTTVLMPGFQTCSFLELVPRERVTHTFLVPTQFKLLLADPKLAGANLSSLRIVVSSGSRLPPETKAEILKRMTRGLMELYGMTEGVATVLEPEQMAAKLASVGRAIEGTEVRIIDDQGTELARGEIGEIVGYTPTRMRGYYKKPHESTAIVWRAEDGSAFLKTGDIGRLDEDGFLYILDRKKDMIVSGGVNVYASDLEEVFAKHQDVAEVAAIAVPHEKWGETPLVLVVPRGPNHATPAAIRAWGNERLGKHQRVSQVEIRDKLPRNALGKVLKRELREPYWAR